MLKYIVALAFGLVLMLPASAGRDRSGTTNLTLVEYSSAVLPPANYRGQWWTSPDNCQYSRAGRPGETVWYLIVNTAHSKCEARLIQRAYSDYQ
ncbi:hypothetical protein KX928_22260 [Roseobacter sp. YSTF-M11]|uniref:Uncharacterized protein n=1 Tax=Roseobacter insulae TaxID=2859783 RepID=A0A9X1K0F5_9RHOB|nr:hypothetical protein [Roseobacter insulae]MBW4710521.1 hypothetical protein [Roseobacter insulae]